MLRICAVVVFASCASPSSDAPDASATEGDAASTIDAPVQAACSDKPMQPRDAMWTVAGRTVRVHAPATYDPAKRTAIVLGLHGLGSSGADQAYVSRMNARADAAGFVAIYPDGTGTPRGWNGGVCCGSTVDDSAFIAKVLDEAEARLCVDTDRIHTIGLSNGGFLSHRLGCELSARIASIGAVAGVLGIATCNPSRPVPVFHVHGTSDFVIPYNGGGVNGNESVATTIDRWKTRNGCTGAPVTVHEQADAKCVMYGGCTDGADVTLCTIDGGGHQWPGGESIGTISGKKSDNLDATGAAWQFFAAHARK
jgi:polyhydroxybutyrate depolymerase